VHSHEVALAELQESAGAPELVVGVLITVPEEEDEVTPVREGVPAGVPDAPELPTVPEVPLPDGS
jgi:hypothetical protein